MAIPTDPRSGDLVKVDKSGREFIAEIDEPPMTDNGKNKERELRLIPPRGVSYYTARAREVSGYYRKLK